MLVSIVIPTKDRPTTAAALVRAVLQFPSSDFEVVVQDCSASQELGQLLDQAGTDSRLQYAHTGRPVSMTENWNAALDRVRGRYVTIVGDDDGVSRKILEAAHWAEGQGIEALSWPLKIRYFWPDHPSPSVAGALLMAEHTGELTLVEPGRELEKASEGHGLPVAGDRINDLWRLPRTYHGLVALSSLRALRQRTGAYFKGLAPDFYIAFALTGYVGKAAYVDFPLSFLGHCRKSNSGRGLNAAHRRAPQEHVDEYESSEVPDILPDSIEVRVTLLADSLISGLIAAGRPDLVARIDLPTVYAEHLVERPFSFPRTVMRYVRASRSLRRGVAKDAVRLLSRVFLQAGRSLRHRLWEPLRPSPTSAPADKHAAASIGEAMAISDSLLAAGPGQRLPF